MAKSIVTNHRETGSEKGWQSKVNFIKKDHLVLNVSLERLDELDVLSVGYDLVALASEAGRDVENVPEAHVPAERGGGERPV